MLVDEGSRLDALAVRASAGDQGAQEALLEALSPVARRLSWRLVRWAKALGHEAVFDLDDAYQEVRCAMWREMPGYVPGPYTVEAFFGAQAKQRTTRLFLTSKKNTPARWWPLRTVSLDAAPGDDTHSLAETLAGETDVLPSIRHPAGDCLHEAVQGLLPNRRRAVVEGYRLGLTDPQLAAHLGCSPGSARMDRWRGVQDLRRALATPGAASC